jgi:glutamyl-tRNA(Gln) amidotransferase subunit E
MSSFDKYAPDEINFSDEGFLSGLEFHQQLIANYSTKDTHNFGSKLFCNCPVIIRDDTPDFSVIRQQRAVSGETGEIDITANFEKLKKYKIRYEGYHDTTCLIELDEEPIMPINQEALFRTLAISKNIFKLNLVDEILISRKTIIDGSNTSGFQRTAMVAYKSQNSFIEVNGKKISIVQVNLEEDSAKNTGTKNGIKHYRLDRLGTPLIEIATGPDMSHPEEVLSVAKRIGELLRTTGWVRRGQGTIRQDLNISISKGTRIEIKGVSDLDLIPLYSKNEAIRQKRMLELLELFKIRNITIELIRELEIINISELFSDTKVSIIQKNMKLGKQVFISKIPKFKGLLEFELQKNYRLGTEFSQICKVISEVGGIMHSDEIDNYELSSVEIKSIEKKLSLQENDAFIILLSSQEQAKNSLNGLKQVLSSWILEQGIVPEVRSPRSDGTTGYLRPLPGKARMYPETDALPYQLNQTILTNISQTKFEFPEDRIARYKKDFNLSEEFSQRLSIHPKNSLFEIIVTEHKVDPTLVANTILSTLVNLRRDGFDISKINDQILIKIFSMLGEDKFSKDALELIFTSIINSKSHVNLEDLIANLDLKKLDQKSIEKIIEKIISDNIQIVSERGMGSMGLLMRIAMEQLGGKADGKHISDLIKKKISS